MSDADGDQLRAIITTLVARTRQGKLEWDWDEEQATGTVTLGGGQVIVSKDRDFDTVVDILNTEGNVLASINVGYSSYIDLKEEADELYGLADRVARQKAAELGSILRELRSAAPPPPPPPSW